MKDRALRVMGTPDTLIEPVRERAMRDLGFEIEFVPLDGLELQRHSVTRPDSFDVLDHWSLSAELAWTARAIRPIDVERIEAWDDVMETGRPPDLRERLKVGKGVSPRTVLFVQPDGALGPAVTGQVSMVPTLHHFDSFGYHPDIRADLVEGEEESWGWLLDERWRGKVALTSHPPIGSIEMALAAQARGLLAFRDVGNLEIEEIDRLVELLIEFKRRRHFRAFWESSARSVELMRRGDVRVESMWPQAIQALRNLGAPVVNAAPREGTRAWMDGLSISSKCAGHRLDRAYAFVNWWLGGWAGAYCSRYGAYMTAGNRVALYMEDHEWAYWYEGEPARFDILDNHGRVLARAGRRRTGGSYRKRMRNIAVWNTFMEEYTYLVRRWNDFLSA